MGSIGTFGSFTQARLAIYAAHKGLSVTGNNIANVNTTGYTRQRLEQSSFGASGADRYYSSFDSRVGNGVLCTGLTQLRDPYLDIRYRGEMANVGSMDAKLGGLENIQAVLGYRDSQMFLKEEFEQYGPVYVATEDGSFGAKGNVLDAIRENGLDAQVIYACGPTPMLRALKAYAGEQGMECWLSLEEKMACGVGACLACVCRSKEVDGHSHVHNKRVCKDGPVFLADEIEL